MRVEAAVAHLLDELLKREEGGPRVVVGLVRGVAVEETDLEEAIEEAARLLEYLPRDAKGDDHEGGAVPLAVAALVALAARLYEDGE